MDLKSFKEEYFNITNNFDGIDIILSQNNISNEPFMKPNSCLSWHLFFHKENFDIDIKKEYIESNIKHIQGFEKIEAVEIEYKEDEYCVYLLKEKGEVDYNNLVGIITFDNQLREYQIENSKKEKTQLLFSPNNIDFQIQLIDASHNKLVIDITKEEENFAGEWFYQNKEVTIQSDIVFNDKLQYKSKIKKISQSAIKNNFNLSV